MLENGQKYVKLKRNVCEMDRNWTRGEKCVKLTKIVQKCVLVSCIACDECIMLGNCNGCIVTECMNLQNLYSYRDIFSRGDFFLQLVLILKEFCMAQRTLYCSFHMFILQLVILKSGYNCYFCGLSNAANFIVYQITVVSSQRNSYGKETCCWSTDRDAMMEKLLVNLHIMYCNVLYLGTIDHVTV